MREVFIDTPDKFITLAEVHTTTPIFVKNDRGELHGMVVHEKDGWIVKVGGSCGAYGHQPSRKALIEYGQREMRYTFHVDF